MTLEMVSNTTMKTFLSSSGNVLQLPINMYHPQELLSDGGSPDSSGADRYSINSDEERDPLTLNNNLLNVDIFLNKPSGRNVQVKFVRLNPLCFNKQYIKIL